MTISERVFARLNELNMTQKDLGAGTVSGLDVAVRVLSVLEYRKVQLVSGRKRRPILRQRK